MQGKPTVIKFFAPAIDETVNSLINTVDEKMRQGAREFILLISSPVRIWRPREPQRFVSWQ
jgi:hypothetical protein